MNASTRTEAARNFPFIKALAVLAAIFAVSRWTCYARQPCFYPAIPAAILQEGCSAAALSKNQKKTR